MKLQLTLILTFLLSGCTVHYTINVGEEIGEQTSSSETKQEDL